MLSCRSREAGTVREIFDARPYDHDDLGLLLEEVVNPVRRHLNEFIEGLG